MARYQMCIDLHVILRDEHGRVLLGERRNTGWADGQFGLPSGHLECGETATAGAAREAEEEVGVVITTDNLRLVHVMHHHTDSGRLAMFFEATTWSGEVSNMEPDKCAGWLFFDPDELPANVVPYIAEALAGTSEETTTASKGGRKHDMRWFQIPSGNIADTRNRTKTSLRQDSGGVWELFIRRTNQGAQAVTATDLFAPLAALDWTDLTKVIVNATNVLDRLAADRELLGELAAHIIEDAELARLCEHYDVLEKLVLHDDPAGWRCACTSFSMASSIVHTTTAGPTPAAFLRVATRTLCMGMTMTSRMRLMLTHSFRA